ncbi:DUF2794 domain-containing protein [Sphingobium psychrophilum]|uniref:DUF2794 domain-containing protein n=1 Tax=Sphingobium psychrophilum TaxID=2728834 RepID=UPI0019D053FB|nr:DUF2794 domain-containing protein [Sphingobium psychrophilum]
MSNVTPFPHQGAGPGAGPVPKGGQVGFDRLELQRIMDLYGRMVSAGHWRDYAMDMGQEAAIFSAFRRSAERPEYRIEKRPALRHRQGVWALVGESGQILKRGQELQGVLAPVERKLLRIVED